MRAYITASLKGRSERVVTWQRALTALPALGPEYGGTGEAEKAAYLLAELARMGVTDVQQLDSPDPRVPSGKRPNIIARIPGKSPRTVWILGHMDVVPPGDLALWHSDPWELQVDGDVLIGRGVEDNQQAIVSALLLAQELLEQKIVPDVSLGLLFVAEEETGNTHGMDFLAREHADLFGADDMFVVPDFGVPDGSMLEVAEKHVLWLKCATTGKQCHGSMPHKGVNAMLAGSELALRLAELGKLFPQRDELFDPPLSTFTPTRREANVPNVNSVPGTDIFYVDCRILPEYAPDAVLAAARDMGQEVANKYGAQVEISIEHRLDAAPPTPADSPLVQAMLRAIKGVMGVDAQLTGVGGSTVACYLRKLGLPAVVWSRLLSNCHEPNEKSLISNAIGDAQVVAHLLFAPSSS